MQHALLIQGHAMVGRRELHDNTICTGDKMKSKYVSALLLICQKQDVRVSGSRKGAAGRWR